MKHDLTPLQQRILNRSTEEWSGGGCIGLTYLYMGDDALLEHRLNDKKEPEHRLTPLGVQYKQKGPEVSP